MFCAPGLVFGGTEGVGSRFHVLRAQTHFRRYRGRPILFLWFLHPDMFLAVRRASRLVFMFCAPRHVSRGTEGIRSRFHVLISRTHFRRYGGSRVPFSCFVRQDSFFSGTEGIRFRFLFLRSRARFRQNRGCRLPFLSFAFPDSFSAIPMASSPIFMFCAPELVFSGTEGIGSRIHVLRSRTHFRWSRFHVLRSETGFSWYRGRRITFSCFDLPNSFTRYRRHWFPFSCFALLDSFSAVPRASGPVFKFCDPRHISCGIEGVGSRFLFLRTRTHFRRYQRHRYMFSCFALPGTFLVFRKASGLN
jgi:hypothetical protein